MAVIYRKNRVELLDDLWELECQAQAYPMSRDNFASCLVVPYWGEVQMLSHSPVGFYICHQVLDECALINIGVAPHMQGQGFGQQLLERLIGKATSRGAVRCNLEVRRSNFAAIALYTKLGFVKDGIRERYYPTSAGREDAILMSKNLT